MAVRCDNHDTLPIYSHPNKYCHESFQQIWWMDEWMDGKLMNVWLDGWLDWSIDDIINGCMERRMDGN